MKPIHELLGKTEVYCVQKGQPVLEVARYMTERNVGAVGVLDRETLVGIFTERDLMMRVVSEELPSPETPVEQVMTRNPVVVDTHASLEHCLRIMNQAKCRHLPVVTDGKLVGMVSMRDLLIYNLTEKDNELDLMRAFIHYVPPSAPSQ